MVDCRPLLDYGRNKNEELRTFDILSSLILVFLTIFKSNNLSDELLLTDLS